MANLITDTFNKISLRFPHLQTEKSYIEFRRLELQRRANKFIQAMYIVATLLFIVERDLKTLSFIFYGGFLYYLN